MELEQSSDAVRNASAWVGLWLSFAVLSVASPGLEKAG